MRLGVCCGGVTVGCAVVGHAERVRCTMNKS